MKHTAAQLESSVVDKEREIQRRVQAVREEEWQKLHKVESEKYVKSLASVLSNLAKGHITAATHRSHTTQVLPTATRHVLWSGVYLSLCCANR